LFQLKLTLFPFRVGNKKTRLYGSVRSPVQTMGADLGKGATKEEVKAEVEGMGVAYHPYADAVVENDIDGRMLGGLTEEELGEFGVTSSFHKRKLLEMIGDWVARNETIFASVASSPEKCPMAMSVSPEVRRLFSIIHQHSMCDAVPSAGVCEAVSCTSPVCALHAVPLVSYVIHTRAHPTAR
jgi:hypothetical protein